MFFKIKTYKPHNLNKNLTNKSPFYEAFPTLSLVVFPILLFITISAVMWALGIFSFINRNTDLFLYLVVAILAVITLPILVKYTFEYFRYKSSLRKLPLTEEELEANHINSFLKYAHFLSDYLLVVKDFWKTEALFLSNSQCDLVKSQLFSLFLNEYRGQYDSASFEFTSDLPENGKQISEQVSLLEREGRFLRLQDYHHCIDGENPSQKAVTVYIKINQSTESPFFKKIRENNLTI